MSGVVARYDGLLTSTLTSSCPQPSRNPLTVRESPDPALSTFPIDGPRWRATLCDVERWQQPPHASALSLVVTCSTAASGHLRTALRARHGPSARWRGESRACHLLWRRRQNPHG